jgi:hypothetical protein
MGTPETVVKFPDLAEVGHDLPVDINAEISSLRTVANSADVGYLLALSPIRVGVSHSISRTWICWLRTASRTHTPALAKAGNVTYTPNGVKFRVIL